MHTPHDPYVRVRGAREHNLRGVDVDIPRDALVVFTGVSGSGKSSLAFGTVYAEAQRRYFESVAPYARRLIHQWRGRPAAAPRRISPRRSDGRTGPRPTAWPYGSPAATPGSSRRWTAAGCPSGRRWRTPR